MVQVLTCLVHLAHYEGKTGPERGSDLPEVTQQLCSQDQLANIYWEHLVSARPFTKFLRWVHLVLTVILYHMTFLPPLYRQGNTVQRGRVIFLRSHSEFAIERKLMIIIFWLPYPNLTSLPHHTHILSMPLPCLFCLLWYFSLSTAASLSWYCPSPPLGYYLHRKGSVPLLFIAESLAPRRVFGT